MALLTDKNIEVVAPAGNIEKLQFAIHYGAHAVYFGGQQFNLRATTKNFSVEDIEKAVSYAHNHQVKAIFLLNAFLHETDIQPVKEYIRVIKHIPFDAIMVSDPGMALLLQEADSTCKLHLSTQMSTLNHLAIQFWQKHGIARIVLARETTLDEIKMIRDYTNCELEIFCHGALCIAYSGRCLLSRYLTGRDANQGNCAHPCRWNYSLVEEKRPGNHLEVAQYNGTEILSSKDLCLIQRINEYIQAGVNAFKIEGRMKSLYYVANTARIYRHAIDCYNNSIDSSRFKNFWTSELDLVSHRPYTDDLFHEFTNQPFEGVPYIKKALFMGYCTQSEAQKSIIKTFNPIYKGDNLDIIYPITNNSIRDSGAIVIDIEVDGKKCEMAQPNTYPTVVFDKPVDRWAIVRKRL